MQDTRSILPTSLHFRRPRPAQQEVPPSAAERERLRRAARDHADEHHLVPPLSLEDLRAHSTAIVEQAGLPGRYCKFAAVLLSNAAWGEAVAAIPFSRRLLLLPQCLRDHEGCQAQIDQFGLVCRHCGRCLLHELGDAAERLGYVVLVAEGTAVVTSLIASGTIDAIVGVSCLSVLERVFPYMEAAAIPGLAVPLLQDGCASTSVDLDWVWDAIHLTSADRMRRLDLDALRAEVASWFAPERLAATLGAARSQTEAIACDWLARSGKRWRPLLAVCAYQAFQDDPEAPLPDDLRKLAVAIECFHKASLVHDDIEDNDAVRYGQSTLHEEYGVPIALNVGDFLLGEGYRMIAEAGAPPDREVAMLRAATSGHLSLCLGQGEELCWMREPRPLPPGEVLDIFQRKTAPAFEVALSLGALRGGADGDVGLVLRDYSDALGVAYQIRDELTDFRGEANEEDGALSPSLLLAIACERASGETKRLLEELWRRPSRSGAMRAELSRAFDELGVEEAALALLEHYKLQAIRSLRPLRNASLKGLLRRVIARIFREVKTEG